MLATESHALSQSRPNPHWSEQSPDTWWDATVACMNQLAKLHNMNNVLAIGLSGQMHGAVLLDKSNQVLRPAILWNDGRSELECVELERLVSNSREITGNLMMPGFTAPKLLWIKKHEPECHRRIHKVLLPKDFLNFKLTGNFTTEMSDASGSMWLDVANRTWNQDLISACGLTLSQMPELLEGTESHGNLHPALAELWGMHEVPVVAGAGDNAAGAVGIGVTEPGQAMLSLGTSGVYFIVSDGYHRNTDAAVHSFCHALPQRWHLMSVCLSAASCLQWFADNIAFDSVSALLSDVARSEQDFGQAPIFLPYLSGERTPHNNPKATGVFVGLTHDTDRVALTYAVLEGVCFALRDGCDAVHSCGITPSEISLIGGGARSTFWRQLLSDCLNLSIHYSDGNEIGPAMGAALLAKGFITGSIKATPIKPVAKQVHQPDAERHRVLNHRFERFKTLYPAIF